MIKSVTVSLLGLLGLLSLTGCPGDDATAGTESETDGSTGMTTPPPPPTTGAPPPTAADTTVGGSESGSTTEAVEPLTLLERVIEGVGGRDELTALVTARQEVSGERSMTDELFDPGGPSFALSSFDSVVSIDFDAVSVRNDITRTVTFLPMPVEFVVTELAVGGAGGGGYVSGLESLFGFPTGDMSPDRFASTIRQATLLNPHLVLKGLLAAPDGASEAGTDEFEGQTYDLLEVADDVFPLTLWVDPDTNLIRRLTTLENSHLRRDVVLDVAYGDWMDADGVLFPRSVQLRVDGELFHDETRAMVQSNPELDADVFTLPPEANPVADDDEYLRGLRNHQWNQSFVAIGIPLDGLQTTIATDELAPGVHHVTGGTHHSMVVEQEDGVVVFEAPLNLQRCEAILEWIDAELGGAPVTHIVLSHHHTDHASCARTFVATGATLVVHEAAEAFFEQILAAPSTIEPDRLEAAMDVEPVIEVVPDGGMLVLDDVDNPIEVFTLQSVHAADLVFPFVSSAGVAFIVDIYNPGNAALDPNGGQEVLDAFDFHAVRDQVMSIAGGHGGVVPLGVLEASVEG